MWSHTCRLPRGGSGSAYSRSYEWLNWNGSQWERLPSTARLRSPSWNQSALIIFGACWKRWGSPARCFLLGGNDQTTRRLREWEWKHSCDTCFCNSHAIISVTTCVEALSSTTCPWGGSESSSRGTEKDRVYLGSAICITARINSFLFLLLHHARKSDCIEVYEEITWSITYTHKERVTRRPLFET